MLFLRVFVVSLWVNFPAMSTLAADQVLTIKPRPGVNLKMLADDPGNAKAIAILDQKPLGQMENDAPQPQLAVALGLDIWKKAPPSSVL